MPVTTRPRRAGGAATPARLGDAPSGLQTACAETVFPAGPGFVPCPMSQGSRKDDVDSCEGSREHECTWPLPAMRTDPEDPEQI